MMINQETKMIIPREKINEFIYTTGSNPKQPRPDLDFFIATNLDNVWDYDNAYKILEEKPSAFKTWSNKYVAEFPKQCSDYWIREEVQNNYFVILALGRNTPFGDCSSLHPQKNLETALRSMESWNPSLVTPRHYGTGQLFLGRLLKSLPEETK